MKWQLKKKRIKEGPLRETTSRNGKGKMASVAREVLCNFQQSKRP